MGNFAVSASDEVIAKGKDLLEKMAKPGDRQGDVLGRIFKIVEDQKDGERMRQGGVDVQALDSSLANIRNMFLASVTGKDQVIASKDDKISEVKSLKDQMERDLREKLDAAKSEKEAAIEQAGAAARAAAQAVKEAQAAKEQAETANNLVAEKDRTIATLADKLSATEAKIAGYDDLMRKESESKDQINDLLRTLETEKTNYERRLLAEKDAAGRALADAGKDRDVAIRELQAQMERKISEAEKDAALATATAVAEKEREMTALLRAADKENARLQARIELLEERIRAMESSASK